VYRSFLEWFGENYDQDKAGQNLYVSPEDKSYSHYYSNRGRTGAEQDP
jgi:hypothetical protein